MGTTYIKDLRAKIQSYAQKNYEKKCVYPPGFLYQDPPIFTEDDLDACLRTSTSDLYDHRTMVKWILKEAVCVFALLLLIDRPTMIRHFYKRSCDDHALPLSRHDSERVPWDLKGELKPMERFTELQWSFLAPALTQATQDEHWTIQFPPSLMNQNMDVYPEVVLPISDRNMLEEESDYCAYAASLVTNNTGSSANLVSASSNNTQDSNIRSKNMH